MAAAAVLLPIAFSTAKVTAPALGLGAVFGALAYYFEDWLVQHRWVFVFMAAFAGVGLGVFLVIR